jgi:hypothetical protein
MKLTNFRIRDTTLEVEGTTFDLHDVLQLVRQSYDVPARRLVLNFSGSRWEPDGTRVDAELELTFEEIAFLRIQIEPIPEDTNACLLGFEPVQKCIGRHGAPDIIIVYEDLFTSEERTDWTGWYVLTFIHGPDILVKAAEARATFTHENRRPGAG